MTHTINTLLLCTALASAGLAFPVHAAVIPLCPGLTIVTAINQKDGDYESIKTIESITDQLVRIKYSSESTVTDILSAQFGQLKQTKVYRSVRREDLKSAKLYQQRFFENLAETVPETTAIGTSTDVLNALKSKGQTEFAISNGFTGDVPIDREKRPNIYDYLPVANLERAQAKPVMVPVMVNDSKVDLPAIHARGDFGGDKSEFFFLDDANNPLTLKFRVGIDAVQPPSQEEKAFCETLKKAATDDDSKRSADAYCGKPEGGDTEALQVVKITYRCAAPEVKAGAGQGKPGAPAGVGDLALPDAAGQMEQALAKTGKIDVYDIYFSFNSDQIREESEPRLKEIADVLSRNPDWKLSVNGHTDNIASDSYNLELSKRRAAAVKDALVKRYKIDGKRLATSGSGKAAPKDTNETLEGRARNRRVELVKQ